MRFVGIRDTYHQVLVRACLVAGDETQLAGKLGIPVPALVGWLLGDTRCPPEVFLRAVDIVLVSHKQQVLDNRAFLEQVRRRHRR